MLWFWPVCGLLLFATLPARQALLWSVIGGFLLLPSSMAVQFAGFPDLGKVAMISIGTGLGAWLLARRQAAPNDVGLYRLLSALFLLSPLVTASLNPDPIVGRAFHIKGMTFYDGISQIAVFVFQILPFWAARRLLADEQGHRLIVVGMLVAMVAYSLPILLEIRLSPQLHTWIYGFFPHVSFGQQMRDGGFRAVVFLTHGLVVALFIGMAVVAAAVMGRQRHAIMGFPARLLFVYLVVVLLLQKTLGATALAFALSAVVFIARPRRQIGIAALIAALVLTYPLLRGAHVIPLDAVQSAAGGVSDDRSQSFQFRTENEEKLLARAELRPWFGWGSWGRNRIYDPDTGRDLSVTDGTWIIAIGSYGWVGYLAQFGLLALPLFRLRRAARRGAEALSPYTAGLALMLAFNLMDLIPNSSLTPITWLMAGALTGRIGGALRSARAAPAAVEDEEEATQQAGNSPGDKERDAPLPEPAPPAVTA